MNELERTLVLLGRELDVPEPPDLAPRVLSELGPRRRRPALRRLALALALVLVALVAATLSIPSARSALLRVLHIGGVEIVHVDRLPPVEPNAPLEPLLGRRVSLAEARRAAGFPLRTLDERPDGVFVSSGGTVWFLYGTPAHVRLLVAQTPHERVERQFFGKLVAAGTTVEEVSVEGTPGAFLSGSPHEVILLDEHGVAIPETTRLARNVLIWSHDGVAYRLEGDFTRDQALEIAGSLH